MKIFYHKDLDGECSAFWVLKLAKTNEEKTPYPIDYGEVFPFEIIGQNEEVYIVDYSIEPEEMIRLLGITPNVTWIDHHETAIRKYEKYGSFASEIRGVRQNGIAGCELTWIYLAAMTDGGKGTINKDVELFNWNEEIPAMTRFIGDRDVWTWHYGEATRDFCSAMMLYPTNPESRIWEDALADPDSYLKEGRTISRFQEQRRAELVDKFAYYTELNGHKALACNAGNESSELFESVADCPSLLIMFCFDGEEYKVSLRSSKIADINVAAIAEAYGGGGHRGAAGFRCKELPFQKRSDDLEPGTAHQKPEGDI